MPRDVVENNIKSPPSWSLNYDTRERDTINKQININLISCIPAF